MNRQVRMRPASYQTREESDGKHICGYFSTFKGEYQLFGDCFETVDRHAFDDALGGDIRALIDHDTRLVLGRTASGTLSLSVDDSGLYGDILINEDDQDAMNLYARVKRGDVNQCSFGFEILEEEVEYLENGGIHWTLKKVNLFEVSVCTFPAYKDTEVEARRADADKLRAGRLVAWKQERLERVKKLC